MNKIISDGLKAHGYTREGILARPCYLPEIVNLVNSYLAESHIFENNILENFLFTYQDYLKKDSTNNIIGLENFKSATYIHGTIQSFDYFYLKYSHKRLRWKEGEFAYHRIAERSYGIAGKSFTNFDELIEGDMLIISIPFSASCEVPDNFEDVLCDCDKKGIPVLIDFAYLAISRGIEINLDHDCIKVVSFSLSKCYYGIERLRAGLRLTRKYVDDPIDYANEYNVINFSGAYVATKLINNFPPSKIYDEIEPYTNEICKQSNYFRNKTIIFASIEKSHSEFEKYKRSESNYSRKCISEQIALNRTYQVNKT